MWDSEIPSSGVCTCGGKLTLAEIRRHAFDQFNEDISIASKRSIEEIYTCENCDKCYGRAKAAIESEDIQLFDPDPDFLKGVDFTNGKA